MIEELNKPASFVSLLYYLGLVTVKEINVFNESVFIIPNETVKTIEYDYVVKALNNAAKFDESFYVGITKDFKKIALKGEWEGALNRLIGMYYRNTSLRDSLQKELALKMFAFALLSLDNFHRAISETEQSRGYVDIYLKLKDKFKAVTKYEYLLEFKYIKANEKVTDGKINSLKNDAIEQLNRYEESEEIKEAKESGKLIKKLVIIGSSKKFVLIEEV